MPQLTNIVIKDGAATPADHTFVPRDIRDGVATVVETTGTPVGDSRISFALGRTANGRQKVTIKFVRPVVQDQIVNGISRPLAVRAAYADITFSLDSTSGRQERKDVLKMMASLLGHAFTEAVVADLQNVY